MCRLVASGPPRVGRTWSPVAPMIKVSGLVARANVRVALSVPASTTATLAEVMSPGVAKLMLGVELVLYSKPEGTFKTSVTLVPAAKSVLVPSAIVIPPKSVHAPDPPVAAVSLEIAEPPDAPVMMTAGQAEGERLRTAAKTATWILDRKDITKSP